MTRAEERHICPHCGAESPRHAEVTRCVGCAQLLDEPVRPPTIDLPPAPDFSERRGARPKARDAAKRAPSEPPPPAGGWRAALTIPAGVYVFLLFALTVGGSLGGSFLMYSLGDWFEAITPGLTVLGVFAGAILGLTIPPLTFLFVVPVRCPKCSGLAVWERNQSVVTFRCKSCGHVHRL